MRCMDCHIISMIVVNNSKVMQQSEARGWSGVPAGFSGSWRLLASKVDGILGLGGFESQRFLQENQRCDFDPVQMKQIPERRRGNPGVYPRSYINNYLTPLKVFRNWWHSPSLTPSLPRPLSPSQCVTKPSLSTMQYTIMMSPNLTRNPCCACSVLLQLRSLARAHEQPSGRKMLGERCRASSLLQLAEVATGTCNAEGQGAGLETKDVYIHIRRNLRRGTVQ